MNSSTDLKTIETLREAATAGRRLLPHLQLILSPHRWEVAAILLLIGLTSLVEGVSFSLLVPLTQALTSGTGQDTTTPVLRVYEGWLAGYTLERRLALLGLILVALFALKNALQYLREVLSTSLWLGIGADTRLSVLVGILKHPYRYFLDRKQGTLVQHLYHEPHHVAYIVQMGIEQGANLLTVGVLFTLLILVSWQVTAFVLAAGVLFGLVVWRLSKASHAGGEERQATDAEAMALLTETIGGIRQVKVFSAEQCVREVYERSIYRFRDLHLRHGLAVLLPQHVTELFWIVILGILLCLPALGIVKDVSNILPMVAVFSAVAFRVGPYVSRISQGWLSVRFFLPALEVVGNLLDKPEQIDRSGGIPSFRMLQHGIQMECLSFFYGDTHAALSDVSVRFNRGETTAIIGPSGAGKSTLVDLLVRLYEPTSGRITVDGVDLRDYELASWLGAMGFVSQDTFIFHGSIGDNIAFSKPWATVEEVQTAARLANAHEFIERLPEGYETIVGDRGVRLSGGERQRIAIARALIRNPQVLIFDEATSALDNQSESLIQRTIASIACDRTVILVAHRLTTIVKADRIIVLDKGKVVEEGTHATLVNGGGVYATLYGKESG